MSEELTEGCVYLVCAECGFFYGDIRLYPAMTVCCPDCDEADLSHWTGGQ